jgi:hypothetical protein
MDPSGRRETGPPAGVFTGSGKSTSSSVASFRNSARRRRVSGADRALRHPSLSVNSRAAKPCSAKTPSRLVSLGICSSVGLCLVLPSVHPPVFLDQLSSHRANGFNRRRRYRRQKDSRRLGMVSVSVDRHCSRHVSKALVLSPGKEIKTGAYDAIAHKQGKPVAWIVHRRRACSMRKQKQVQVAE